MTLFHQRDAKWAKDKMGSADYEIGKHGCVITALCNIAAMKRGKGSMWNPHYLNKSLVNLKGYTNGNVYWDKAAAILSFKSIESMWYVSGTNNRKKLDFDKYYYNLLLHFCQQFFIYFLFFLINYLLAIYSHSSLNANFLLIKFP